MGIRLILPRVCQKSLPLQFSRSKAVAPFKNETLRNYSIKKTYVLILVDIAIHNAKSAAG